MVPKKKKIHCINTLLTPIISIIEEISGELLGSGVIHQLCVVALNVSDQQILQQIAKTVTRLASRGTNSQMKINIKVV